MTRNSLRTLPDGLAELVARHLAAAIAILPDDPKLALAHAAAAVRLAGRVAVVREAAGVAAYAAGDYGMARTELRAAARISGTPDYLPMLADCERGLGRPEKALELAASPEVARLDVGGRVEMLIVAAGARRDKGQDEAAVLTLQVPALRTRTTDEWLPRLRYAYADALLAVGRVADARSWFLRAAEVDPEGMTDAVERVDEIDGVAFDDVEEQTGDEPAPDAEVGERSSPPDGRNARDEARDTRDRAPEEGDAGSPRRTARANDRSTEDRPAGPTTRSPAPGICREGPSPGVRSSRRW